MLHEQDHPSVHRRTLSSSNATATAHNAEHNKTHTVSSGLHKDVLVVSREPLAHAVLFRNKTRVVIQVTLLFLHVYTGMVKMLRFSSISVRTRCVKYYGS